MSKCTKTEQEDRGTRDALTEVMRAGARKLIAQALDAEVAELLAAYADQRDAQGRAVVVSASHSYSPGPDRSLSFISTSRFSIAEDTRRPMPMASGRSPQTPPSLPVYLWK